MRAVEMGLELAPRGRRARGVPVPGRRRPHPDDEEERDEDAKEARPHARILHEIYSQTRARAGRPLASLPH